MHGTAATAAAPYAPDAIAAARLCPPAKPAGCIIAIAT
jgi:hypothetical protein